MTAAKRTFVALLNVVVTTAIASSCTIGVPIDERNGWTKKTPSPTAPGASGAPGSNADGGSTGGGGNGGNNGGGGTGGGGGNNGGGGGDNGGGGGDNGGGGGGVAYGVPSAPLRRLTQSELNHTLRDLFVGIAVPEVTLNDGQGKSYEGDVARQTPSDLAIDQMRTGSLDVAAAAIANKATLLAHVPAAGDVADETQTGHDFVASFGAKALRRPLDARELGVYDALFDTTLAANDFDVALQIVIAAFLQAPSFLYRVEIGGGGSPDLADATTLTPYETASRLSYLLWSSMPDQQLFDAAAANELATPDQIEAQARRMLADAKAEDAVLAFARQWLDLDKVLAAPKDAATYPTWSDALAQSIRQEADEMITEAVFGTGDAKLRTLLTTTTTRVDAATAALYGVAPPASDWDLVQLPGNQRAGVLTEAAFLAARAHEVYPSPVLRGVSVLDHFLCEAPPPPGGAVVTTPPAPADPSTTPTTNRQRYAEHTSNAQCQACHVTIDGIGMGFEEYDAIGRYRTTDNGYPVDATGTVTPAGIDNGDFDGAPALAQLLASSPAVEDCVARHWMTLMRGRAEETNDTPQIDEVSSLFETADGDVKELLIAMVRSLAFRTMPKVTG